MAPPMLLVLAIVVTLCAAGASHLAEGRRQMGLRLLASEWEMNYSPHDQFRLTSRLLLDFPVAGAAKIRVVDLIYAIDRDVHRYIFTAEYTAGVVSGKHRVRRAASFTEPRERAYDAPSSPIILAPASLPILEQYRRLGPRA